jgi:cytochrome P450
VALSWFFYELTRNPQVEARILDEIDAVGAPMLELTWYSAVV